MCVIRDTVLRSVVLPAPLGPRRATISPCRTSRVTFSRTIAPPYPELTASSRKSGVEVGDVFAASKISLLHDLALADLGGRALEEQLAMVKDDDAVRQRHDEVHVVLDDDHDAVGRAQHSEDVL